MGDFLSRVIEQADKAGDFVKCEDGFVVYWPDARSRGGAYNAQVLRLLADELDRRNESWSIEIEAYFEKEKDRKRENVKDMGNG